MYGNIFFYMSYLSHHASVSGGMEINMKQRIQKYIREIILPVMTERGFQYSTDEDGDGIFRKKCEDGVRTQQVIIQLKFDGEYTIDLDLRIEPSNKYFSLPLGLIIAGDRKLKKGLLGGWVCNTAEEAKAVLEMIARNMEKRGFRVLDRAGSDPEDICPTPSEHRDLYENHQKYAEEFQKEHGLSDWEVESVLQAVQYELEKLPSEITQEARKRITYLAAACGEIFIARGGGWVWRPDMEKVLLKVYDRNLRNERLVVSPLALIYSSVSNGCLENVCLSIKRNLKGVKKI